MIDLQNFFTAAKSTKFPQNPHYVTQHTLSKLLHYLGKLKNLKFSTFHACKICFKCDFLSSIQQVSVKRREISAKIDTMENIDILLCLFTVLNKPKALQLSKVGLSTIKHQHGKNLTRWTEAT